MSQQQLGNRTADMNLPDGDRTGKYILTTGARIHKTDSDPEGKVALKQKVGLNYNKRFRMMVGEGIGIKWEGCQL
jgi:hypothetical protein